MIGLPHNNGRASIREVFPSVARISGSNGYIREKVTRRNLTCAFTMERNQARFLQEGITYHAWLEIERRFIYNNSSDSNQEMIEELDTQVVGFLHCALRARDSVNGWVSLMSTSSSTSHSKSRPQDAGDPGSELAQSNGCNLSPSTSGNVSEIRTTCHSFRPSGLTSILLQSNSMVHLPDAATQAAQNSIMRMDALDVSLLNEVHHFRLREGFRYIKVPESIELINHCKYQVWVTFRSKFFRRVSTFVADWQEHQTAGSKDGAPGLSTEPIEPSDWPLWFCKVCDTAIKDLVLANFTNSSTRMLPWQICPW